MLAVYKVDNILSSLISKPIWTSLDNTLGCRTRFQKREGKTWQPHSELQHNFHSLIFSGNVCYSMLNSNQLAKSSWASLNTQCSKLLAMNGVSREPYILDDLALQQTAIIKRCRVIRKCRTPTSDISWNQCPECSVVETSFVFGHVQLVIRVVATSCRNSAAEPLQSFARLLLLKYT